MREITMYDTKGRPWVYLQPETEEERRELAKRTDLAKGGIDERDEYELEDNFSND